jgi:peptide/nickel transport system substrate-binding protein
MRLVSRKPRYGVVAIGTAVLVGGAALAGCGAAAGSSGSASGSPSQTLTIVGGSGTTLQADFNPFQVATLAATGGADMLYLPLEAYNPLNGRYIPYLATGLSIVSAEQVDFTLRSGVKWSNGTAVTPADVVYSFGLLKKYPALDTTGIWQELASVSASGDTIIFKLKTPDSQIASNIAQIPVVPEKVWSRIADPDTFANASPTVVDGPYELQSFSPIKVIYQKNPRYFGIAAMSKAPDTVTGLPQEPGADQVLDLEKGIFDWNETNDADRGGFATDYVAKDPAHNHYWVPAAGLVTLYLNLAKAPFNDPKFRLALDYAIDRKQVSLHANINGYETAATQTGLLPADDKLIPSSLAEGGNATYDPAKAKQILLSDGYRYSGSKLIGKNGQPVTFTLQTIEGFVDWLGDAEEIAAELGQLGITVQVSQVEFSAGVTNVFSGEFDTAIYFGGLGTTPYSNYQSLLASYLSAPVGKPAAGDYGRVSSPQVDGLLNQIASSTSAATQNAAIGSIASYIYTSVPVIELTIQPGWFEYTTTHYTGWPDASDPYADPVSTLAQLEVIPQLKAAG